MLASVIAINSQMLTWSRLIPVGYNSDTGRPEPAAYETESIDVKVQPLSGRDLRDMPEGVRSEDAITCFTLAEVKIEDLIEYEGNSYRVNNVKRRPVAGYREFTAIRKGEPE